MSQFDVMIRHTRKYNDRIKKFCAPLFKNFGFNSFFYHYISNEGHGTSFGSDIQSFEYYYHNDLYTVNPYARHPDYFETSVHLIPHLKNEAYKETIDREAQEFDIDYRVIILQKNAAGCEGFSFATSKSALHTSDAYIINQLPILQCFIERFKESASDVLAHISEDQLYLKNFIGEQFHSSPHLLTHAPEIEKKMEFLKQMGILQPGDDIDLSARESECIKLLLKGYKANDMAEILNLSKRTVEHYLENVKLKANCFSKQDLFDKFRHIEALGLLS